MLSLHKLEQEEEVMLFGKHRVRQLLKDSGFNSVIKKYGQKAVGPLLDIMRTDSDIRIRKLSAEAIESIGYQFTNQQERIDFMVAAQRFRELARVGETGVKSLLPILCQSNWFVREAAADALVELGKIVVEYFIPLLKHNDLGIRKIAAVSLEKIGYFPNTNHEKMIYLLANQKWSQVIQEIPLKQLIPYLKDEYYEVRYHIGECLVQMEKPLHQFIEYLKDNDEAVRDGAITMLSEIRSYVPFNKPFPDDSAFMERIAKLLSDEDKNMRLAALRIIGLRGYETAESAVENVLKNDPDKEVRSEASSTKDLLRRHDVALKLIGNIAILQEWSVGCDTHPTTCAEKLKTQMKWFQAVTNGMPDMGNFWHQIITEKITFWHNPNVLRDIGILMCPNDRRMIPTLKEIMMKQDGNEAARYAAQKLDIIGFYPTSQGEWQTFLTALGKEIDAG